MTGSSPRRRGPQHHGRRGLVGEGLIPAQAGTTTGHCRPPAPKTAHPRAGGDHCTPKTAVPPPLGSSPRRRGPQRHRHARAAGARLIPAQAGTTLQVRVPLAPPRAHPRAGGDHLAFGDFDRSVTGSSPRRRGPRECGGAVAGRRRLIPAQAGTTGVRRGCAHRRGAHPRAGGDHLLAFDPDVSHAGSSPRRRGPLPELACSVPGVGLIPAQAGTTHQQPALDLRHGLIPAQAGTTGPRPSCAASPRAHPRAGGDHGLVEPVNDGNPGSSPRRRGPLAGIAFLPLAGGLIPAQAGTTTTGPAARRGQPAHPRAGGDHTLIPPTG